jgi:phosphate starvation-inducible protein PhoH and related proteins
MGVCDKIIFTRPSVSVDEELGFLPGTLEDKMAPWMRPLYDILYGFINPKELQQLIEEKVIEISPIGFMRGRTFKNCCIIADEMQNCTLNQMKMILTRIGENTRLFITGDLEQCDRMGDLNGLEDFLYKIRGRRSDSITSVEFGREDIEREDVVKEVLDIYSSDRVDYFSELSSEEASHSTDNSEEDVFPTLRADATGITSRKPSIAIPATPPSTARSVISLTPLIMSELEYTSPDNV